MQEGSQERSGLPGEWQKTLGAPVLKAVYARTWQPASSRMRRASKMIQNAIKTHPLEWLHF